MIRLHPQAWFLIKTCWIVGYTHTHTIKIMNLIFGQQLLNWLRVSNSWQYFWLVLLLKENQFLNKKKKLHKTDDKSQNLVRMLTLIQTVTYLQSFSWNSVKSTFINMNFLKIISIIDYSANKILGLASSTYDCVVLYCSTVVTIMAFWISSIHSRTLNPSKSKE